LADGSREAARKLGRGADKLAVHVKGQDSIEPFRVPKGWALGVATSPVAGRHLRGTTIGGARFGPKSASFQPDTYEDQAKYSIWQSLTKEMEDTLGICVYVGTWSGAYALEPSDYAELANGVLGTDLNEEDFFFQARRSYNLEKAFNTLHTDLDRKDDYPPARFREEPVLSGRYKGEKCDRQGWEEMLDRFYELQEWDRASGLQTKRLLEKLDLPEAARRLEEKGKLIP